MKFIAVDYTICKEIRSASRLSVSTTRTISGAFAYAN